MSSCGGVERRRGEVGGFGGVDVGWDFVVVLYLGEEAR